MNIEQAATRLQRNVNAAIAAKHHGWLITYNRDGDIIGEWRPDEGVEIANATTDPWTWIPGTDVTVGQALRLYVASAPDEWLGGIADTPLAALRHTTSNPREWPDRKYGDCRHRQTSWGAIPVDTRVQMVLDTIGYQPVDLAQAIRHVITIPACPAGTQYAMAVALAQAWHLGHSEGRRTAAPHTLTIQDAVIIALGLERDRKQRCEPDSSVWCRRRQLDGADTIVQVTRDGEVLHKQGPWTKADRLRAWQFRVSYELLVQGEAMFKGGDTDD